MQIQSASISLIDARTAKSCTMLVSNYVLPICAM